MKYSKRTRILMSICLVFCGLLIGGVYMYVSKRNTLQPGQSTHTITVQGRERHYRLYVPESLGAGQDVPLTVVLHGALGTGKQAESSYGWNEKADAAKFIVAYPDGLNRSWAVSEGCCGPPARDDVDDVLFIEEMVASIKKEFRIDENRVYATGISNGGALAYRLACDTTTFAAVGAVATTLLGSCPDPSPVSVMHIHGTADQTFPYAGGPGKRHNDGEGDRPADTSGPAIADLMDMWRRVDDCAAPEVSTRGTVTTSVAHCADGKEVKLVTIDGAGHQWPGSSDPRLAKLLRLDPPSKAINATDELWDFFEHQLET